MARIAGVNIPNHQHAEIALTAIYGIGRPRAKAICVAAGVPPGAKIKELTDAQMDKLRDSIGKFTVEGEDHVSGEMIQASGRTYQISMRPCCRSRGARRDEHV